jgi:hypothetical protein
MSRTVSSRGGEIVPRLNPVSEELVRYRSQTLKPALFRRRLRVLRLRFPRRRISPRRFSED